jgi:hypothetical protein
MLNYRNAKFSSNVSKMCYTSVLFSVNCFLKQSVYVRVCVYTYIYYVYIMRDILWHHKHKRTPLVPCV